VRLNDAASQILKHSWCNEEDAFLRELMKNARIPWKQIAEELHGRTNGEMKMRFRWLRKMFREQ
jgi:hypothetical protein